MGTVNQPPRLTNLCMMEPAAFGFNAETATTNRFQQTSDGAPEAVAAVARAEFGGLVQALRAAGAQVCVVPDTPQPVKPDAVFPNNWLSLHEDGTVVLYPMRDPTRRTERREGVIDQIKQELHFVETRRIDLSTEERHERYLEGTGSLVLDREARIAYACRSPRTDAALVREWCRLMDYEPHVFDAATADGTPVYHTNVVLWIGARVAGAGLEWVSHAQRKPLAARLQRSGRTVLALTPAQLMNFAGNMLEIPVQQGRRLLAMSATAAASLDEAQQHAIAAAGCEPVIAAIPTIEMLGGGSVRCMLAEVPANSPHSA
jgi:hypothetical protein